MTYYKYIGNKDPQSTVGRVVLERDNDDNVVRELVRGGESVNLTDEEHELWSQFVQLRKSDAPKEVKDDSDTEAQVDSEPNPAGTVSPQNLNTNSPQNNNKR